MNRYQACLDSVECISHGDSKYGHETPQCWHFNPICYIFDLSSALACRVESKVSWWWWYNCFKLFIHPEIPNFLSPTCHTSPRRSLKSNFTEISSGLITSCSFWYSGVILHHVNFTVIQSTSGRKVLWLYNGLRSFLQFDSVSLILHIS